MYSSLANQIIQNTSLTYWVPNNIWFWHHSETIYSSLGRDVLALGDHHSLADPVAIKNSPSHTRFPPTYAFPSIFAIPKRFCNLVSVILMIKVSPAITGFRNLTLSIPAKKKFSREPPTSGCSITRPPTWAIAYMIASLLIVNHQHGLRYCRYCLGKKNTIIVMLNIFESL